MIHFYKRILQYWIVLFFFITLCSNQAPTVQAQGTYDPTVQTGTLLYNEARTVYLGNLARLDNGAPPLRWNRQLTYAARWFSWDSTENRPSGFCGHQDTQGHWPDYRALTFGYLGSAGAENAYCGYLLPEDAIQGWMNSPGHRANLLDANSREIGLGYYRRASDGRGYVTQDFGNDAVYAPVIIENEAVSTLSPNVNLYIYDRSGAGGFAGFGAATQMMVSNDPQFNGAVWEPYRVNKAWTLANGTGWREVYVKTRDAFNRTLLASDAIYLGAEATIPLNEIGTGVQMSTTYPQVTLHNLNGGTLPQVQFSLGWMADDTFGTFDKLWGNGERVSDAAAWGGTAYRLYPGNGESSAWVWDSTFIKNVPMTAYFRLKVNDNTSNSEVARVSVQGGNKLYGPLSLRGTDFTASDQYQEFALNFTFTPDTNNSFLIFQFWQSGSADVYIDTVSIFTAPQMVTSPLTWSVPGSNYRGQGIWIRYTDGTQFSQILDAPSIELPLQIFSDVSITHWARDYIERLYRAGITGGCDPSPLRYCPDATVTRAQMAVFLLRGIHGPSYSPPDAADDTGFADVPANYWAAAWIKELAAERITGGCGNGNYCPDAAVTRDQMAVFLLRSKYGSSYSPPAVGNSTSFGDVSTGHWAAAWIKQLVIEGITAGCASGKYCPAAPVSRAQMAVFLVKTFHLP